MTDLRKISSMLPPMPRIATVRTLRQKGSERMKNLLIDPRPGQRLRQVRLFRHLSQGQLAKAIGVSVGTVQNYERGRVAISADRIAHLSRPLQCEPTDLLMVPGSPLRKRQWRDDRRRFLRSANGKHIMEEL
jgi:transcriptional regulator with XRE-family HTH domain